ncbi:MAG: hypothetical protein PQJ46_08240 [Spirochaetales bacterium]|nr:hypothetical protein [Spirochaetales bacterium]
MNNGFGSALDSFFSFERDGREFVAIPTSLDSKDLKNINVAKLKSREGFIVDSSSVHPWIIEGFTEKDGSVYFYGAYRSLSFITEEDIDFDFLNLLIKSFKDLKSEGYKTEVFSFNTIFLTEDKKLLFLPDTASNYITMYTAEAERLSLIYPWNSFQFDGDSEAAFIIASLIYRFICGEPAFSGESFEVIQRLIKQKNYRSPLIKEPRLLSDLAILLDKSFNGEANISEWEKLFNSLSSQTFTDSSITETEAEKIKLSEERKYYRLNKRNKTKEFLVWHKTKIIIIAISVAFASAFIIPVVSRALAPPVTVGMTPVEVVNLYYESFNTVESEKMTDCVIKKVGKDDIRQVNTITVITRARMAYEGSSSLVSFDDWNGDGRPELSYGALLWGINVTKVEKLKNSDSFAVYYEKWISSEPEDEDLESERPPIIESIKLKDIVHLSPKKDYWVIDDIERMEEE